MAYIKNTWVDQNVEKPKTYNVIRNTDSSVTLVDNFGQITELGTPVNAENMNHIEDGVAGVAIRLFNLNEIFALDEWVKDGEKLFKSLQDQNQGHATSEAKFWEEVKLGGGGGSHYPTEIFSMICDDNYTPEGASKLNGQEYGADMFLETWNNYLTDTTDIVRAKVCTYEEYAQELATNGYVMKFAVDKIARTFKVPTATDEQMESIISNDKLVVKSGTPHEFVDKITDKQMTLALNPKEPYEITGDYAYPITYGGGSQLGIGSQGMANLSAKTNQVKFDNLYVDTTTAKRPQRHFFVYLANAEIGDFTVNYNEMMSALNGKLDTDVTNATQQGKELATGWGIPDYDNPIAKNVQLPNYRGTRTEIKATQNCLVILRASCASGLVATWQHDVINVQNNQGAGNALGMRIYVKKGKSIFVGAEGDSQHEYDMYPLFDKEV